MMIKFRVWPLAGSGQVSSSCLAPDNMQEAPESKAIVILQNRLFNNPTLLPLITLCFSSDALNVTMV